MYPYVISTWLCKMPLFKNSTRSSEYSTKLDGPRHTNNPSTKIYRPKLVFLFITCITRSLLTQMNLKIWSKNWSKQKCPSGKMWISETWKTTYFGQEGFWTFITKYTFLEEFILFYLFCTYQQEYNLWELKFGWFSRKGNWSYGFELLTKYICRFLKYPDTTTIDRRNCANNLKLLLLYQDGTNTIQVHTICYHVT